MYIKITKFYRECTPMDYSASPSELGQDAGTITFNHALEDAPDYQLIKNEEEREALRDYLNNMGMELDGETNEQLDATFLQLISGDIRESFSLSNDREDWEGYYKECEEGMCSSSLFKDDDGEVYYCLDF